MDRHALICRTILEHPGIAQREMARRLKLSLGTVNSLIKECLANGQLSLSSEGSYHVAQRGEEFLEQYRVDGAFIIAAGFGSRFVPLTFETPKGLLEVFGERMIERQIRQLHQAGIRSITIAVGYLKEKFEYLIDKYQVELLYNREYASKNTLATLYHARKILQGKNMYLLPSDNWLRENMFHAYECGPWYSSVFQEGETSEWVLSFNKKGKIQHVEIGGRDSWVMYGPAFFTASWSEAFLPVLEAYYHLPGTEQLHWEQVYMELVNGTAQKRLVEAGVSSLQGPLVNNLPQLARQASLYINCQPSTQVYEFENLEELRMFDTKYQSHSNNQAMELISSVFQVEESEIQGIRCLKSGMTNKSFLFQVAGKHYICRIPGPGTERLINRRQEGEVFQAVGHLNISEQVIYFNQDTGYKIARYYEGARNADAKSWEDIRRCMGLLRVLHKSNIRLNHRFNIRERIGFYESLCYSQRGVPFEDYAQVRKWMDVLMDYLDGLDRPETISHIDSCVDNFLFLPDGDLKLIDWEYCGMCEPLIDVAMCAIYSYYDEPQIERLVEIYLQRQPTAQERLVVYSYVALGGFLWSLWAVYKSALGEEFGEYTIIMYRYAKRYYRKVHMLLESPFASL